MTRQPETAYSRVGFGTASLMRVPSARRRQDLLAASLDCGISHFDVARMYGLGEAEREVGKFIRGRRDRVTLATKFGIEANRRLGPLSRFQAPARALLERFPQARRAVKQRSESFAEPRRYDAAIARASLETSLRQLGTDYVDLLFVHDPTPVDEVHTPELLAFFEEQLAAGTIRAWGVSQDAHPGLDIIGGLGPDAVLQIRDDVLIRQDRTVGNGAFTFGVLGRAHAQIASALRINPPLAAHWRAEFGFDPLAGGELARLLLADAFEANPHGTVIYSTVKPSRVAVAASVAGEPRADAVFKLRELVARNRAEIGARRP